jgi:hypothetical protein
MATLRPRGTSVFTGFFLIFVGIVLLLHNYKGLEIGEFLRTWWPLILILWGGIKLYERTVGRRSGETGYARITAGEVFLVFGLLILLLSVAGVDEVSSRFRGHGITFGETYPFDLDLAPKAVPADARITVRNDRGDITVSTSDTNEIRVSGKKKVTTWNEEDAEKIANPASVEIVQNGDGYEIHPTSSDSRVAMDLDISIPKKSALSVRSEQGDITISDLSTPVTINSNSSENIEVRDTSGDVSIDARKGDIKVSDTKGNVKISGKGGQIDVTSATGGLTLNGEFYGPIRADKIAKGVRFISKRTDLTLTQLTGHIEAGSGNLEIVDAPGNIALRTNSYDVSIENATGKVQVDNRNGEVSVRFSAPPKEDVNITNSNSTISLTLPGASNFDINADCHSCDIESDFSGDSLKGTKESENSHLEGKYGTARGPKITLKTSYGELAIRKTS